MTYLMTEWVEASVLVATNCTVYRVIGYATSTAASSQLNTAELAPGVAVTLPGAAGNAGVRAATACEGADVPTAVLDFTVTEYSASLARPVSAYEVADAATDLVIVAPPEVGSATTV